MGYGRFIEAPHGFEVPGVYIHYLHALSVPCNAMDGASRSRLRFCTRL
jgi:hypothetical protein